MISLENDRFLTLLQKLPKDLGDLGKLIVAKGFKKLPKVQKIANLVTMCGRALKRTSGSLNLLIRHQNTNYEVKNTFSCGWKKILSSAIRREGVFTLIQTILRCELQ